MLNILTWVSKANELKLLRLGNVGQEIPAAIDRNGKYRNLLSHIKDFTPETINFENLEKLRKVDLENLEEIDQNTRIGSCIAKPGNFFAIGLLLNVEMRRSIH